MSKFPITQVPLDQLVYQSDPAFATTQGLNNMWRTFLELEKTLPVILPSAEKFVYKQFPRIANVYKSIKENGLKNPLIVRAVGLSSHTNGKQAYKVEVGNQRLCVLRALKWKETVPCQVIHPGTRTLDVQQNSKYHYIEGTEGGKFNRNLHLEGTDGPN